MIEARLLIQDNANLHRELIDEHAAPPFASYLYAVGLPIRHL